MSPSVPQAVGREPGKQRQNEPGSRPAARIWKRKSLVNRFFPRYSRIINRSGNLSSLHPVGRLLTPYVARFASHRLRRDCKERKGGGERRGAGDEAHGDATEGVGDIMTDLSFQCSFHSCISYHPPSISFTPSRSPPFGRFTPTRWMGVNNRGTECRKNIENVSHQKIKRISIKCMYK